LSLSL